MPQGKPNIVVFWGDEIGISNLSCYSDGLMGYRTPNIDRLASEGMRFTDSYGEQSCPTSAPTSPPTRTGTGISTACSCSCRRRASSRTTWARSSTSRRG
jgi:arylsulfatase A-like enzyme